MDKDGYHGYYRDEPFKQRPWVGLTEQEKSFIYDSLHATTRREKPFWVAFADAIEAKLKEKNNG